MPGCLYKLDRRDRFKEYINAGFAQPVTDLVSEMGLDSVVMPSGLEQGTVDGEIYALPILNIAIEGFYYNKDMFEQVGITEEPTYYFRAGGLLVINW